MKDSRFFLCFVSTLSSPPRQASSIASSRSAWTHRKSSGQEEPFHRREISNFAGARPRRKGGHLFRLYEEAFCLTWNSYGHPCTYRARGPISTIAAGKRTSSTLPTCGRG